jgi:hypothetical protein
MSNELFMVKVWSFFEHAFYVPRCVDDDKGNTSANTDSCFTDYFEVNGCQHRNR